MRIGDSPRLKVTGDLAKATLPGRKRLMRVVAADGSFIQDVITLADEEVQPGETVFNPDNPLQQRMLPPGARFEDLRSVVMAEGERTVSRVPSLDEMADRCADQLRKLPPGSLRFINPHRYKVSISSSLKDLRIRLMEEALHLPSKGEQHG